MKRFLILTACFILSLCVASDSFATFYGGRVFLNRNGITRDVTNVYRVYAEDMEDIDAAINLGTAKVNTLELWIGGVKIINSDGTFTFGAGDGLKTGVSAGNTLVIQAYDVDGAAYSTFATWTANNTPSLAITEPAGGALTIDGADIGVTTPAAANFSTIGATTKGTGDFTTASVSNGATSSGILNFYEDSDNGTNKVSLQGPASTADVTIALPAIAGTVALVGADNGATSFQADSITGDTYVYGNEVAATGSRLTAGVGTVNETGRIVTQVFKVTIDKALFIAAAVTQDLTLATLPAKTIVHSVIADVTEAFSCTGVCTTATLSATVGVTGASAEYLASFDMDAAVATFGDADGEVGTAMNVAGNTNGGSIQWASSNVVLRATSGTGNWGDGAATNLATGSVTVYIIASVLP